MLLNFYKFCFVYYFTIFSPHPTLFIAALSFVSLLLISFLLFAFPWFAQGKTWFSDRRHGFYSLTSFELERIKRLTIKKNCYHFASCTIYEHEVIHMMEISAVWTFLMWCFGRQILRLWVLRSRSTLIFFVQL